MTVKGKIIINKKSVNHEKVTNKKKDKKKDNVKRISKELEKLPDDKIFTKEQLDQIKKLEKTIKDINRAPKTNLIYNMKFKSPTDKYVFEKLPLSDFQKEQMITEIYGIDI